MRVLLTYKATLPVDSDPYISLLPVGLGYINAALRGNGLDSRVANLSGMGWREVERLLKAESPSIIGVSQFTHNRFEAQKLAALAKRVDPGCFVVFGGPHATQRFREVMEQERSVDAVVLGEGEESFLELVESLSNGNRPVREIRGLALRDRKGVVTTPPRDRIADLDGYPFPARFFDNAIGVDKRSQMEFIITSRGCPCACRFCASPGFWGRKIRFRSSRSIVDEIRFIRDHYGLIYFSIRDDTFTLDRDRVIEFCRLLLEEKVFILWNCQSRVSAIDDEMLQWMKLAGCECIQFGVESGSARVLDILGKRIELVDMIRASRATRAAGINLSIYLISGVPRETAEDLEATLRLIDDMKTCHGQVSPLAYYPGTALFENDVAAGIIRKDLFESEDAVAFYARNDRSVAAATRTILAKLTSVARKSRYRESDFLAQKKSLGYCHATNVVAGEYYESEGKWKKAESEYLEIVDKEPDNPWGWLLLGELYDLIGYGDKAKSCYKRLGKLVPNHESVCNSRGGDQVKGKNKKQRRAI